MNEVKKALNVDNLEPLQQFLHDDATRNTFSNLLSGNY